MSARPVVESDRSSKTDRRENFATGFRKRLCSKTEQCEFSTRFKALAHGNGVAVW
jgi:hypothetical protein